MSTFEHLLPFFDNNGAAKDLVALNYSGCEFSKAIDVKDIEYEPMLQAMLVKNYETTSLNGVAMKPNGIHYEITDLIKNIARFHAEMDPHGKHNDSNAMAKSEQLYNDSFRKFSEFTEDERKFYMTFLSVVEKQGSSDNWKQEPFDVPALNASTPSVRRVNLNKVNRNDKNSAILFGTTLPPVPESVDEIYFSDGKICNKTTCKGQWVNALRDLYQDEYLSLSGVTPGSGFPGSGFPGSGFPGSGVPASSGFNLLPSEALKFANDAFKLSGTRREGNPYQRGGAGDPNAHLNLNFKVFVKNCIVEHAKKLSNLANSSSQKVNLGNRFDNDFDDLYVNMVNGSKYMRDGDELYRLNEDGSKGVAIDEAQIEKDLSDGKCGVGIDDKAGCRLVRDCLLSGNKRNLAACLDMYKDQDMFKVAQREVSSMNPKIALQLLETFGFTPKKETSGLYLPPTFEHWMANILPKSGLSDDTIRTIKSNNQLMQYLRGVVQIIRSNPAILNKDLTEKRKSAKYGKDGAELQTFYQPTQIKECDMKNMTDLVLQQSVLLSRPVMPALQMPLGMQLGNVNQVVMPNFLNGAYRMQGGGSKYDAQCVNACALESTFKFTLEEMERNGKMLVDEDKARIAQAIDKVARREKQLVQLLDDLRLFTKLNRVNPNSTSTQITETNLNDVTYAARTARESGTNITEMALGNLSQSVSGNINETFRLINDLLKVQQPLVDVIAGRNSTLLSSVNTY
jgi:hypothetical protein